MKKLNLIKNIKSAAYKTGFRLKKSSPEILIAVGVVGVVASAVMACKATLKVNDILDNAKDDLDKVHDCMDNPAYEEEYSEQDGKKDITVIYAQTGLKLAKTYAPSVILGAASIGAIISSHRIIRKRNIALAAAYATVDKSFKEYRSRAIERFGKDVDKELKYGIKAKDIVEKITDEDGNEKTITKTVNTIPSGTPSEYAVIFNRFNKYWEEDSNYSLMFLKAQEQYANDLLRTKGHLTLNTVYEALGFEPTKAGMVVGWIYDDKHPVGDNYVEFGLKEIYSDDEQAILLDFNVDGNIYDLL